MGEVIADFAVPGAPVAKGRPRFTVREAPGRRPFAKVYTPPETADYETRVKWYAKAAMRGRKPYDGAVAAIVILFLPIPASWSRKDREDALRGTIRPTSRPDLDNYLKAVGDGLNGIVLCDDSQITTIQITKVYGATPQARVIVQTQD